jgi:hypothetical protein
MAGLAGEAAERRIGDEPGAVIGGGVGYGHDVQLEGRSRDHMVAAVEGVGGPQDDHLGLAGSSRSVVPDRWSLVPGRGPGPVAVFMSVLRRQVRAGGQVQVSRMVICSPPVSSASCSDHLIAYSSHRWCASQAVPVMPDENEQITGV